MTFTYILTITTFFPLLFRSSFEAVEEAMVRLARLDSLQFQEGASQTHNDKHNAEQ